MFKILSNCKYRISFRNTHERQCLDCICWDIVKNISTKPKSHYETLKLSRNCSVKEIREAFITLSKQYHPDKNEGNPKAQEEFVKVNEAYNVLIKPESRRNYDFSLWSNSEQTRDHKYKDDFYEVHRYDSNYRDPWKDPSFSRNRRFHENTNDNYYGIKGIKKQSNDKVVFWILMFAGVGLFVQIIIIRFANLRLSRDRMSDENRRYLEYIQARADYYGTHQRQLEAVRRRLAYKEDDQSENGLHEEDRRVGD